MTIYAPGQVPRVARSGNCTYMQMQNKYDEMIFFLIPAEPTKINP